MTFTPLNLIWIVVRIFLETIRNHIPVIDNEFKDICEATLTIEEIKLALFSMKKKEIPWC